MSFLLDLIKSAVASVMAFLSGMLYSDYKAVKKEAKHAKSEAEKWANAPNEPTPDRLRRLAEIKRKRETKLFK